MGVEEWNSVERWTGLVASIWIQSFAGTTSTFATYSPCLKSVLQYTQVELNNLGVAKDFGENVGLVAGYFSNKLPAWMILMVASLESLVGYGILWLVASERIPPLPYWQICTVQCLAANSCTWFNTAILLTSMRNFPHNRGTVVGIVKAFMGISGAIFTQIYTASLAQSPVFLLLMLAVAPGVVSIIMMMLVHPVPVSISTEDLDEKDNFLFIHILCVGLGTYILGITLLENLLAFKTPLLYGILLSVVFLFLIAPLYIPIKLLLRTTVTHRSPPHLGTHLLSEEVEAPLLLRGAASSTHSISSIEKGKVAASQGDIGNKDADEAKDNGIPMTHNRESISFNQPPNKVPSFVADLNLDNDLGALLAVGEGAVVRKRKPRRGEDFNLRQTLVKADFWLLFFIFFCGIGSGVTAANNLGQMGQAQGYKDAATFVALFALGNFIGRLGGGSVSEHYLRFGIPRSTWIGGAQAVMVFVHFLFAAAIKGSLYVGSLVLGICYGIHYSVIVPTLSELFGLKHFGKMYNVLTIGDPLASVLFSGLIAGYLFDQEAKKQGGVGSKLWKWSVALEVASMSNDDGVQCVGAQCYRLTFIIMAGVCVVGVMLNIILGVRIRPVYKALYASKDSHSLGSKIEEESH